MYKTVNCGTIQFADDKILLSNGKKLASVESLEKISLIS